MHVLGSNVNPKKSAQKDLFLSLKKAGTPEKPIFHQSCPIFLSMLAAPFECGESGAKTERQHFLGHWLTLPLFWGTLLFGRDRLRKKKKEGGSSVSKNYEKYPTFFVCEEASTMR